MKNRLIIFGLLALQGCGGAIDGSDEIINDYKFVYSGGDERSIDYFGRDISPPAANDSNIDSRVDDYRVEGSFILVSRLPREIWQEWTASRKTHAQADADEACEHWVIDTVAHKKWKVERSSVFAQTKCYPLVTAQGRVPFPSPGR